MRIRDKATGLALEATKNEDGTYTVNGEVLSKEAMGAKYTPVKEKAKVDSNPQDDIITGAIGFDGDIGALALSLSKAQGEFQAVAKASSGHGYDYANITDVLKTSLPVTSKYELAPTQHNFTVVANKIHYTGVRTYLLHSGGGMMWSEMMMPTEKTKMNSVVQVAGGITTYLRRYGVQSILGLATVDNDGSDK